MTTNALVISEALREELQRMASKYLELVWYARKGRADDKEYWAGTPEHIKQGALDSCARVQEMYPDECDALADPVGGDWEHGFNSGCLAMIRFLWTATSKPDEHGECGGLEWAKASFPELYT